MNCWIRIALLSVTLCATALAQEAGTIIAEYRKIPVDTSRDSSSARSAALAKLTKLPAAEAQAALSRAIGDETEPVRRREMMRRLWDYPTKQTVDTLVGLLSDPDPNTRSDAVQVLRHFASRVNRRGGLPAGPVQEHPPILPDVVPHLMFASHDTDRHVRQLALYALADSRDPAAIARFRELLQDPDPGDQLHAAVLLAEFNNPAGVDVLKRSLLQLPEKTDPMRYMDAARTISALMRVSGQNFGSIPMDPYLSSNTVHTAQLGQQFDELIQKWILWTAAPTTLPTGN